MADLARIKGNIGKMLAQDAPEEDVDAYIASEGVSLQDVQNFSPGKFGPATRSLEEARSAQLSGATEEQPAALPPVLPKVSQGDAYGLGAADIGGMAMADEAGAAIMSGAGKLGLLPGGDAPSYEAIRDQMRAQTEGAQEQHPNSFLTGQVGGGVAQAVAGGLPALLRGGTTLIGRTLAGMGVGGASGGAHGAGSGTDAQSRIVNMLVEGGIGTAVGGALPAIGVGASNLYSAGRDALVRNGMPAPTDIMRLLTQAIPDVPAARHNIAAAGPDAMVADAGPNARAILDTSIQRGGPGGQQTRQAIEDRATAAGGRVNAALDTAMGAPQGVEATRRGIREGSAGARHAAYDGPNGAYAQPIDYASQQGQTLENLIRRRVPGPVIQQANRLMQLEGAESQQIMARIADDGTVTFERMPDVRQIDYITRALNQAAESGEGAGTLGGQTTLGRAYQGLSREIRNTLRNAVPEYGQALETAADPIRRSQAVEFGSRLLNPSTTRDTVAEFTDGITGPERQALLQGVRSNIDDAIANVQRTLTDPNVDAREAIKTLKMLSSRANREKVAAAIDDPPAVEGLFRQLDAATAAFDLRAGVADNSRTYARQTVDRRVREMTAPGPIGHVLEGKPVNAVKRIIQTLTGRTPERSAGREDALYAQLSEMLTRRATPELLGSIEQMGQRDVGTQLMQERIIQALTGGVRPASALTGSKGRKWLEQP